MKLVNLLVVDAIISVLATGCGAPAPSTTSAPNTARTVPANPRNQPETIDLSKRSVVVEAEEPFRINVSVDGRILFAKGEDEGAEKSLKVLRKKIEDAAKGKPAKGDTANPSPKGEPEPERITVMAKADAVGNLKTLSLEKGGARSELADLPAFKKALQTEVPKDPKLPPSLTLRLDGRLKQGLVVQLIDTAVRTGITDVRPEMDLFGQPAPKLAPLGDDPGGKLIEGAPILILRVHKDAPFAATDRLVKILRGWGVTRVQFRAILAVD